MPFFDNIFSKEDSSRGQKSVTSSRRPSVTEAATNSADYEMPALPSGAQTPNSRASRPLTMKIDEESRYRAVSYSASGRNCSTP
jgi:hypothetical protein